MERVVHLHTLLLTPQQDIEVTRDQHVNLRVASWEKKKKNSSKWVDVHEGGHHFLPVIGILKLQDSTSFQTSTPEVLREGYVKQTSVTL